MVDRYRIYIVLQLPFQSVSWLEKEVVAPALVVPTTDYHKDVPVIVGTNIISRYQELCDDCSEDVPAELQRAFLPLQAGFLGSVRSTNKTSFEIRPYEL